MRDVTPDEAVAHPNWSMGAKISVEFGDDDEQGARADRGASPLPAAAASAVDIVVHPQSIVHGARGLSRRLGAGPARLARHADPDRLCARLGRTASRRRPSGSISAAIGRLTFEPPDRAPLSGAARRARGAAPRRRLPDRAERGERDRGPCLSRGPHRVSRYRRRPSSARSKRSRKASLNSLDDVYNFDRTAREIAGQAYRGAAQFAPAPHERICMMNYLSLPCCTAGSITSVLFLVVLTVLVFVHEFGHYLIARWNGVRIEVFSIGFGPELFGWWDRAGTRWKFSTIPLGGYVKMFGDSDASSGLPAAGLGAAHRGRARGLVSLQAARPARRDRRRRAGGEFRVRDRRACAVLFMTYGQPFTPAEVGQVQPGSAAEQGGIRAGRRDRQHRRAAGRAFRGCPAGGAAQSRRADGDRRQARRPASRPCTSRRAGSRMTDRFGNRYEIGLLGIARSGDGVRQARSGDRGCPGRSARPGTCRPQRCRRCGR